MGTKQDGKVSACSLEVKMISYGAISNSHGAGRREEQGAALIFRLRGLRSNTRNISNISGNPKREREREGISKPLEIRRLVEETRGNSIRLRIYT